jgi:ketosteroid isomerase-like protein
MNRMKAETQGTLSLQVQGTCVVDGMIVVVARATGRRNGKSLEQDLITTYRLNRDGKIRERRVFLEDSGSNDEFWS